MKKGFVKSVKERDKYTCVKCGYVGKKNDGIMHCHHIESWMMNEDLRIEVSNGVTFCRNCHVDFHHIFGIKNNNRIQFDNFIRS